MKKILSFLFFLLFLLSIGGVRLRAQEAIPASGSNATGSGGSVSYTVGQVFYSTQTATNGSIAQGVQQPYEISVVIGIEEAYGINLICSVFPNPTNNMLTLKVENYNTENLNYQLYDISGKLLETKKVESIQTEISLKEFKPASYFLKVNENAIEIKTFKIIKI